MKYIKASAPDLDVEIKQTKVLSQENKDRIVSLSKEFLDKVKEYGFHQRNQESY